MAKSKKKINEKAFKSLLHDIDPKNIAKVLAGKQVGDDIVGKIIGNNQEEKIFAGKVINDTATKINPIEEENGLTDMLSKIYGVMKLSNDRRIKQKELENNYREEVATEKALRHKELMDAIKKAKGTTIIQTAEKVESNDFGNLFGILSDILEAFGGGKSAIKNIFKLGKFFLRFSGAVALGTAPFAAMLLATEFLAPNDKGENTEKQKEILDKIHEKSGFKPLTTDSVPEEDMSGRPMVWGKSAYDARKKKIQERIELGHEFSPEDAVRIKKAYGIDVPKSNIASAVKVEETPKQSVPAQSKDTPTSENKTQESNKSTTESGKETTAITKDSTVPVEEDKSTQVSQKQTAIPESAKTAVPEETINQSVKLNNVINENQTNKLMADINSGEDVNVVNNQVVNSNSQKTSMSKSALPAVRNLESTYQRMIYDSTRVV